MSYHTGSVNSLEDLQAAILDVLASEGWSIGTGAATKGQIVAQFDVGNIAYSTTTYTEYVLRLRVNDAPIGFAVGDFGQWQTAYPQNRHGMYVFPVTWHMFVHTNPNEVYIFCNYDTDYYMWLAFGQSPVPGLPGTGVWAGGTYGVPATGKETTTSTSWPRIVIYVDSGGYSSQYESTPAALFWSIESYSYFATGRPWSQTSVIHNGLDGPEALAGGWTVYCPAIKTAAPHNARSPSAWNSEAILIPIRPTINRPESKVSIVGQIAHARYVRINNYAPQEIITLGSEQWMVFPWYRKDTTQPDGGSHYGFDHSGTFGVALRYA
jgi:hypothetical protein